MVMLVQYDKKMPAAMSPDELLIVQLRIIKGRSVPEIEIADIPGLLMLIVLFSIRNGSPIIPEPGSPEPPRAASPAIEIGESEFAKELLNIGPLDLIKVHEIEIMKVKMKKLGTRNLVFACFCIKLAPGQVWQIGLK